MVNIILHIICLALFVLLAFVQYQFENIEYLELLDTNKPKRVELIKKRKMWRIRLYIVVGAIGLICGIVQWRIVPTVCLGVSVLWMLFDGLFANKTMRKDWWYVGFTSELDELGERKSKLYKILALSITAIGVLLNCLIK